MIPASWQALFGVIGIPVIVFLYRKAKAKFGQAATDAGLRWITFGLSAVFVIVTGQVAGLRLPAFPAFPAGVFASPDAMAGLFGWIGSFVSFIGILVGLATSVFLAATGVYKVALQFILEKTGLQSAA